MSLRVLHQSLPSHTDPVPIPARLRGSAAFIFRRRNLSFEQSHTLDGASLVSHQRCLCHGFVKDTGLLLADKVNEAFVLCDIEHSLV